MEPEKLIEREIAQIESSPAFLRLRALRVALEALKPTAPVDSPARVAVIKERSGLPGSWKRALSILPDRGFSFSEYREQYGQHRGAPIAEGSFAAQLSKMKGADLIHKRGDRWFAGPPSNEPGADLLAETPGSSVSSSQEGGDGDAPATT